MTDHTAPAAFLAALTSRDFVRLAESLAPAAEARLLLPRGPEVRSGRDEIAQRLEGWFVQASEFEVVAATETSIGRRSRLTWRFRLNRQSRPREIIEQVAYVDSGPEGVTRIDLMCSGFLPDDAPFSPVVFDAGVMGCADRLAQEFRKRFDAVDAGGSITVIVSDPAAREDLPTLISMMGQTVASSEVQADQRLAITVEKRT